jgi:hypothetical protein
MARVSANPALPWWFWHLFTAIGVITLTAGVFVLRDELAFSGKAAAADGTVAGYAEEREIGGNATMYAPVITFDTADGERVEFTSSLSYAHKPYATGQSVKVRYDQANPRYAKLASGGARFFMPGILLFLALVFTPLGILGQCYIGRGLARQA